MDPIERGLLTIFLKHTNHLFSGKRSLRAGMFFLASALADLTDWLAGCSGGCQDPSRDSLAARVDYADFGQAHAQRSRWRPRYSRLGAVYLGSHRAKWSRLHHLPIYWEALAEQASEPLPLESGTPSREREGALTRRSKRPSTGCSTAAATDSASRAADFRPERPDATSSVASSGHLSPGCSSSS